MRIDEVKQTRVCSSGRSLLGRVPERDATFSVYIGFIMSRLRFNIKTF